MYTGKKPSIVLIIVGFFNILNSFTATLHGAERQYFMAGYINTHWITSIILFAGLAHLCCKDRSFHGEVFSFAVNACSIAVCSAATLADLFNFHFMKKLQEKDIQKGQPPARHLFLYSLLDLLSCLVAIPFCINVIRTLLHTNTNLPRLNECRRLLGCGTALVVVASIRMALYLVEILYGSGSLENQTYFVNYTLDEPAWIAVSMLTGSLCVIAYQGSPLLRGVVLCLSCTLIWPAIFYMWIDYRIIGPISQIASPGGPTNYLTHISLILGLLEIVILLVISLMLLTTSESRCDNERICYDSKVKAMLLLFSLLFALSTFATLGIDVYAVGRQAFYTVFHANEQKTPFMAGILSILTFISASFEFTSVFVPLTLTVCILTANSTLFQLFSYVYLTYKGYFEKMLCNSYSSGSKCDGIVTREGVNLHLLEALINLSVLIMSICLGTVLIKVCRLARFPPIGVTDEEVFRCRKLENIIRTLAATICLGAIVIFIAIITRSTDYDEFHPFITIYGFVFHISVVTGFVIFPLFTIVSSEDMISYPLTTSAVLCVTSVCFVDTLSHLDYRGTGDVLSREWKVHNIVDVMSLFLNFAIIVCLIRLKGTKDYMETLRANDLVFDNPLRLMDDSSYFIVSREEEMDIEGEAAHI